MATTSSFEDLLTKYVAATIHYRNLEFLPTEMYKISQNQSQKPMESLVEEIDTKYCTRSFDIILKKVMMGKQKVCLFSFSVRQT